MKIYLVRHGEAAWQDGWLRANPGLTVTGRRQASAIASELRGRGISAGATVWSSPAIRAQETAAIIAEAFEAAVVQTDAALRGLSEPTLRQKMAARAFDAELIEALAAKQDDAWAVVERLKEAAPLPDDAAVVVTHDSVIAGLVCRALSIPLADVWRFEISLASITALEFRGQRTLLACLNDVCHLDEVR